MTSPPTPRDRATDKRAAILDAALALFAERGFHGTAVPAVAERAGVGAGTIYRYFPSKEALVNELYRTWKQEIARRVIGALSADAPPRAQFHALWTAIARFARQHPTAFAFLELHHHADYLDADSRQVEDRVVAAAVAVIERAQRAGAVRAGPPLLLLFVVYGALVGAVRAEAEGRIQLTDDHLAAAEDMCWAAIAAPS
ncbi:MAG: TetR/AcrR family transcriptional regulator [Deltaproteobacteria bacterium]|nr:MAG: TetR/AcrR family transcriptional regulator [Deltaproteobacteria bacterium]